MESARGGSALCTYEWWRRRRAGRRGWPEGKSVTKDDLLRTVGVGKEGAYNIIIINLGDTAETINNLSSQTCIYIYVLWCRTYLPFFVFVFNPKPLPAATRLIDVPISVDSDFGRDRKIKKETQNINNKLLYIMPHAPPPPPFRTGRTCH